MLSCTAKKLTSHACGVLRFRFPFFFYPLFLCSILRLFIVFGDRFSLCFFYSVDLRRQKSSSRARGRGGCISFFSVCPKDFCSFLHGKEERKTGATVQWTIAMLETNVAFCTSKCFVRYRALWIFFHPEKWKTFLNSMESLRVLSLGFFFCTFRFCQTVWKKKNQTILFSVRLQEHPQG